MAQLLQPGGPQGGGARAERDLSEAADVLASLGAGAKHDEDGEGEAALPPAPKRLRSSIVRGSDVKRPAVAAQTSQTDHAGSLGPGRLAETLDRLSGPATSSKRLADGKDGLLQSLCQERIVWFLTNSSEETVRPEPLRLDLLTDSGLHFAQAVLAWVGAGFPSSRWRNEQPDMAVLDIFHAILQKEYETQVSTAQPAVHQQLQVPALLQHQAYASTYEAAKRQLPQQLQQPGPDQEVNQPPQPSPGAEPDLQQEAQPDRSQTQDNAFPAQQLPLEERVARLEAADQQQRSQAAQNQAHISQLHALFPRLVERLVTAENRLEQAQSRLATLESRLAGAQPHMGPHQQHQQQVPQQPEQQHHHPPLGLLQDQLHQAEQHQLQQAEQQQQDQGHQHNHNPDPPQQQQQQHQSHAQPTHSEPSSSHIDLTAQGAGGIVRPPSANTQSPSLFLQSLPPGFGGTPVLPQTSVPAPNQPVELGELQGLRSLLLEPHTASMLGSGHNAISALSTLQPTGDSNSASAARAAIAVLASQQSAHSLPEQMRQKLVGLVDDRISHLQSPCPPDPAAGFVAGLQQSAKPDQQQQQQQQQQQHMGFPAFQALPAGLAGQQQPANASAQPWHSMQGNELAATLQSGSQAMPVSAHNSGPAGGLAAPQTSLPTASNALARYYPAMASQPLEEMMAQQQRAGGEDLDTPPGAPCESLRDRAKPWGFPQLSALGSLAEFWLLWNEGSPQAPPEIRKPVKDVRPEGQKGKRQRLLEWRHAAEYIAKRAEAKHISPEEMVRELEQERGHRKIAGYVRALGERLRYLASEPGGPVMQLAPG